MFCGICEYLYRKIKAYFSGISSINCSDVMQEEIDKQLEKQPLIKKIKKKSKKNRYNLKSSPLKLNNIDVPSEIIIEILSFMPITFVIEYRLISTGMKHIIESLDFKNHINNLITSKPDKFDEHYMKIFIDFQLKLDKHMYAKQYLKLTKFLKEMHESYKKLYGNNHKNKKFYKYFLKIIAQANIKQEDVKHIRKIAEIVKATNKNLFSHAPLLFKIYMYCFLSYCIFFFFPSTFFLIVTPLAVSVVVDQFCQELTRNTTMSSETCDMLTLFGTGTLSTILWCCSTLLALTSGAKVLYMFKKEELHLQNASKQNNDTAKKVIDERHLMYLIKEITKMLDKRSNIKKDTNKNNDNKREKPTFSYLKW
ncbi:MAG: F-box protein [Gammaproteobacteria bacterium]|jgi:hypothetical protein